MHGKMFVKTPKGYHVEIVGDSEGNAHKITVPNKAPVIAKAKAFKVTCQGGKDDDGTPNVEVAFIIDGPDAITTGKAIETAAGKYRFVMGLASSVHVKATIEEIKAKIGASA